MESSRRAPPNMNMDFLLLHMPIPSQPLLSRRPSLQIADPVVPRTSDFAAEPASSSVVHTSDDPGGGADDDDPGGGSTNSAEDVSAMVSALNVSNTSKTSSSPLLSSFATGLSLSSSRVSSSVEATDAELDESDDEDFEYKGHFCSGCSIPLPGAVRGWVRGFGGVGCWVVGSWTWVLVLGVRAPKTTIESVREFRVLIFLFDFNCRL